MEPSAARDKLADLIIERHQAGPVPKLIDRVAREEGVVVPTIDEIRGLLLGVLPEFEGTDIKNTELLRQMARDRELLVWPHFEGGFVNRMNALHSGRYSVARLLGVHAFTSDTKELTDRAEQHLQEAAKFEKWRLALANRNGNELLAVQAVLFQHAATGSLSPMSLGYPYWYAAVEGNTPVNLQPAVDDTLAPAAVRFDRRRSHNWIAPGHDIYFEADADGDAYYVNVQNVGSISAQAA